MGPEPYGGWVPPQPAAPPQPPPPSRPPAPPTGGRRNPALPIAIALFVLIVGVGSYLILSGSDGSSSSSAPLPGPTDPTSPVLGTDAPTSIHDNGKDPVQVGKKLAALMNARRYKQLVDMSCAGGEGFTSSMQDGLTAEQDLQSLSDVTYAGNDISKLDGGGEIKFTATRRLYGFVAHVTFTATESKDTKNTLCTDHTGQDSVEYTGTTPWPASGSFPAGVKVGTCLPGGGVTGGLESMMEDLDSIDPRVGLFTDNLKELADCAPGLQTQVYRLFADPIPYLDVGHYDGYPASLTRTYRTRGGRTVAVSFRRHGSGPSADYVITKIAIG